MNKRENFRRLIVGIIFLFAMMGPEVRASPENAICTHWVQRWNAFDKYSAEIETLIQEPDALDFPIRVASAKVQRLSQIVAELMPVGEAARIEVIREAFGDAIAGSTVSGGTAQSAQNQHQPD